VLRGTYKSSTRQVTRQKASTSRQGSSCRHINHAWGTRERLASDSGTRELFSRPFRFFYQVPKFWVLLQRFILLHLQAGTKEKIL